MANGKRVKDFRPARVNANKHTARGMGALQKSIQSDGWIGAMTTAADGEMIAGSARIETVAQVWGTDAEPIVVESDGTRPVLVVRTDIPNADDKRAQRLALADNRVQEMDLTWDVEVLAGFDADVLGDLWTPEELSDLGQQWADEQKGKQEDAGAQIDKAEELRVKWGVEAGQLWQLGEHRLICGDCTDAATVARVMGGETIGVIIADPPYGMRLDADFSGMVNRLDFAREKGVKQGNKYEDVIGDDKDFDANGVLSIVGDVAEQLWFGADYYATTLPDAEHTGAWLVWDKRLDESADKMFGSCFELIWSKRKCRREILRHKWAGIFGTEKEPQRGRQHPNQKPVVLLEDLIGRTGGIVLDPYSGSGTTLIACERLGRKCRAVEISPAYCAVAIERWAQTTGKTPILANGA